MNDQEFKDKYNQFLKKCYEKKDEAENEFNNQIETLSREYLSEITPFAVRDIVRHKKNPDRKFVIKYRTWQRGCEQHREVYVPEWIYTCVELTKKGAEKKGDGFIQWHHSSIEKV